MRSMTGYALGQKVVDDFAIEINLRSVNRKQLDIRLSLPEELYFCEISLRKLLQSQLVRGAVSFKLTCSFLKEDEQLVFDEKKLKAYIKKSRDITNQYPQVGDITMGDLLNISELRTLPLANANKKELEKIILQITKEAIEQLMKVQQREGKDIQSDLLARKDKLCFYTKEITNQSSQNVGNYRQRLTEKLNCLEMDIDESILEREIVLFTDRFDITEELVRLDIHLKYFEELLKQEGDNGRELDFLMQEIGREINTTGAKSQDVIISALVVKFKTELEKCREQIQNLA